MKERYELHISSWSIIKLILILVAFYLLYFLRDILALLFVVLVLVAAFRPVVNRWEPKIGRTISVVLLALMAVLLLSAVIYLLIPPFVSQTTQLATVLPDAITRFSFLDDHKDAISSTLKGFSGTVTSSFFSFTASVFGGVVTFLTAIVLTVYMLLDRGRLGKSALEFIPENHQIYIKELVAKLSNKIGSWFRGQILLGGIIGLLDLIGLLIIGVPYALALAVLSGILEVVPTIGPIISGIIAALIALSVSPLKALLVIIFYIIVQQLENNLIVPKVMQKAVGLSPVLIILAIITGAKLMGVIGAILAIPLLASLVVIIKEWPSFKEKFIE